MNSFNGDDTSLAMGQSEPRTIRLVADIPNFAEIYETSPLAPRMAARLWAIAEIIYDDFHQGVADELVAQLPPIARHHADERFVTAFASRFAVIAKRLAEGPVALQGVTTCTADEMALRMIITYAEDVFNGCDPAWIEQLPVRLDDDDFDYLPELLLHDEDLLLLYNPALDGIEDPESSANQQLGCAHLHPNEWFKPFANHKWTEVLP